jgi:hypothetical protein
LLAIVPFRLSVTFFFYHCDKIPDTNNLKKERFILAHGLQGFSPLWWGGERWWSRAFEVMRGRKQIEVRKGPGQDTPFKDMSL